MELQNPRAAKFVLLGLVAAGLLFVYFGTALLPVTHYARAAEIRDLEGKSEKLALDVQRARRMAAELPEMEARHELLVTQWARARRLLPDETEITALLHEIAYRGQQSGVEFTLFKPEAMVGHSFYAEKPVEIRVEGSYHRIGRFLNQLSQMDRIVHIQNLEIEEAPSSDDEEGGPTARAHFFVSAYVLGDAAVQAVTQEEAAKEEGGVGSAVKRLVKGREESSANAVRATAGKPGGSLE